MLPQGFKVPPKRAIQAVSFTPFFVFHIRHSILLIQPV
jgi:hypothetical protein